MADGGHNKKVTPTEENIAYTRAELLLETDFDMSKFMSSIYSYLNSFMRKAFMQTWNEATSFDTDNPICPFAQDKWATLMLCLDHPGNVYTHMRYDYNPVFFPFKMLQVDDEYSLGAVGERNLLTSNLTMLNTQQSFQFLFLDAGFTGLGYRRDEMYTPRYPIFPQMHGHFLLSEMQWFLQERPHSPEEARYMDDVGIGLQSNLELVIQQGLLQTYLGIDPRSSRDRMLKALSEKHPRLVDLCVTRCILYGTYSLLAEMLINFMGYRMVLPVLLPCSLRGLAQVTQIGKLQYNSF